MIAIIDYNAGNLTEVGAAEFGHMKIIPDGGPLCACGDHGCLESLAAGTSIARIARERLKKSTKTILKDWADIPEKITAELVAKAAAQEDKFAQDIWLGAIHYLGVGVANVVNAFNPRLVILGGGVTNAGDLFFDPIRETVRSRAMKSLAADVDIVPAENGDFTGLMGAVAVARERL